jgi:hypothetical protein
VTQQADKLFEWDRQKLLAGKEKENSQIFNEDFYLPLYQRLWAAKQRKLEVKYLMTQSF